MYASRAVSSCTFSRRIAMHGMSLQLFPHVSPGSHCPGFVRLCPTVADHALRSVGIAGYIFGAPVKRIPSIMSLMSGHIYGLLDGGQVFFARNLDMWCRLHRRWP